MVLTYDYKIYFKNRDIHEHIMSSNEAPVNTVKYKKAEAIDKDDPVNSTQLDVIDMVLLSIVQNRTLLTVSPCQYHKTGRYWQGHLVSSVLLIAKISTNQKWEMMQPIAAYLTPAAYRVLATHESLCFPASHGAHTLRAPWSPQKYCLCGSNGVRRPRQIRGPKIRANVPPKGPCWRHRVCHFGAIVVAWAARWRLGAGRV